MQSQQKCSKNTLKRAFFELFCWHRCPGKRSRSGGFANYCMRLLATWGISRVDLRGGHTWRAKSPSGEGGKRACESGGVGRTGHDAASVDTRAHQQLFHVFAPPGEALVPIRRFTPDLVNDLDYRGTSLIRNCRPLGPYSRTMPRALWGSQGDGCFLMSEVPL